ncbi:MAG: hypothetical protein HYZ81_27270 [Nitrospinae bacterium]|nr:hypothetical protein [Nitrospinota bacterium]
MRRLSGVTVLIVVLALAAWLALPACVQAGAAAPDKEKDKVIELLKLQLLLSRGEHGMFHDALEKLVKKYPNDVDVKALSDQYHETMHKRMTVGEQAVDLLMKTYLSSGGD